MPKKTPCPRPLSRVEQAKGPEARVLPGPVHPVMNSRSVGMVELVMASIERVNSPQNSPDYQPTRSHKGSIPSTLVAHTSFLSIICQELLKPRRDPTVLKSWSLRTGYLFALSLREEKD